MQKGLEFASADAENALLSCLINVRMGPVTAMSMGLTRRDFAWEANALIYDAVERIVERGSSVDLTVLTEELAKADHLSLMGGAAVVEALAAAPSDPNMITEYVNIVRDRSMRRRIMQGFEQGTSILLTEPDGKVAVEAVQDTIYRAFDSYLHSAFSGIGPNELRNGWRVNKGGNEYVPYPYESMNEKSIGRALGTLSIWGGYPSDGKSTMGLKSLITSASHGIKSALISLEMTQEQITERLLSYMTGIETLRLQKNDLTLEDEQLIEEAFKVMDSWDFTLYCDPSITVPDLRSIQQRERYKYIGIDYLQRFDFVDYSQVPRMAKQLKNLALSTLCAIDLLSQVNPKQTSPGANPFTKPDNLSLYGGKATAHEADNIFFIWSERTLDQNEFWSRTGSGLLICTKGRQGIPEYTMPMRFDPQRVVWEEL